MKKKNIPEEIYQRMNIFDLILVSLHSLNAFEKKVEFEQILEKCFKSFPERFGFLKYPEWPDARKLDRPLRSLRRKRLISGNPKEKYSLTKSGQKQAQEVMNLLRQKKLKLK